MPGEAFTALGPIPSIIPQSGEKRPAQPPDGRNARGPLSKNFCAVSGMERNGVTALMQSVLKLDHDSLLGAEPLDYIVHPSAVQGKAGIKAMNAMFRTYFREGRHHAAREYIQCRKPAGSPKTSREISESAGAALRLERVFHSSNRRTAKRIHQADTEYVRCAMTKGRIVAVKRFEIHDGDGIRTTPFPESAVPLRCIWCHNPEAISPESQLAYLEKKCIGCGECVALCDAHQLTNEGEHIF